MIKKISNLSHWMQKASVGLMLIVFGYQMSFGQGACACKQSVNVSLGGDGTAVITAAMLLTDAATCPGANDAGVTVMLTPTGAPIPGSPVVNCSHIGKVLYGKVSNGNNSCWSLIHVKDDMKPVIDCPSTPINVNCFEMENFTPSVSDNCVHVTFRVTAEHTTTNTPGCPLGPNVLKRIVRTYVATDGSGNESLPCQVTINVIRIANPAMITKPADRTIAGSNAIQCDAPYAKIPAGQPFAGNPSPVAIGDNFGTGVPMINGTPLYPDPNLHCNITVSFTDVKLPEINCVTKIIRTWSVIEWSCDNRVIPPLAPQMIEIVDNQGPQVVTPANITVTTSNHACQANVVFPIPVSTDNCSSAAQLKTDITYPGGFIKHGQQNFARLPVGVHTILYTVYDACHNSSTAASTVTVEDNTAPVAICDEFTTVALTVDGNAWVPATVLDDGSYDECGLAKMLVRRMNNATCGPCARPEFPGFTFLGEMGTGASKRFYYLSNHTATPKVALKTAKAMGGYGVSFESSAERTQVHNWVKSHNPTLDYLIGYTDLATEGTFVWESGATNSMTVNNNTASQDYVMVDANTTPALDGLFYAVDNTSEYRYVVEIFDPCGWSSHVQFCCADIPSNQMVAFRVIDKSGNWNDCMVSVVVQDKIPPTITCPAHRTVNCDFAFDANNLAASFGTAVGFDNCENPGVSEVADLSGFLTCRIGEIRRTFTVTDAGGRTASCVQVITFVNNNAYNGPASTDWPADREMHGCDDPADAMFSPNALGRPVLNGDACSLVGADYTDQVFRFNNNADTACFKILRTWTVIDWCQRYQTSGGGFEYKKWVHTQVIKVNNKVAPTITTPLNHVSVCTFDDRCESGSITLTANATDDCTQVLRWTARIYPNNGSQLDPSLTRTGMGNTANASGTYPIGTHRVNWSFEDRCGNVVSRDQLFSIVNCKAPSPVLIQALAGDLMPMGNGQGMLEIWASDFEQSSFHPCYSNLIFSFEPITVVNGVPVVVPSKVFTCADIGNNNLTVYVGVLTPMGTIIQAHANVVFNVQNNNNACDEGGRRMVVSGQLTTEMDTEVEKVFVRLEGTEKAMVTGQDGAFSFPDLTPGSNYAVRPFRNDNPVNGVSTLDLVLIQRHILNIERLSTPYKLIAADATKDGKISAGDLVELRKLILGSQADFTNNTSWRFVDKSYIFTNPDDAQNEAFPEIYDIALLNNDMKIDFIAVKTGDVNCSAASNSQHLNLEPRSAEKLMMIIPDITFRKGDIVTIPFTNDQNVEFAGMQFTLKFNPSALKFSEALGNSLRLTDDNFGFAGLDKGYITFSWNQFNGVKMESGQLVMTLTFEAVNDGQLSDVLALSSDITKAEAYDMSLKLMNVGLRSVAKTNEIFALHQNIPNPFNTVTVIPFDLPEASQATLSVFDLNGKLILERSINGNKGRNTFSLDRSVLQGNGMMYYVLKAGNNTATRKMIIIE
jgi:hypothetical protein